MCLKHFSMILWFFSISFLIFGRIMESWNIVFWKLKQMILLFWLSSYKEAGFYREARVSMKVLWQHYREILLFFYFYFINIIIILSFFIKRLDFLLARVPMKALWQHYREIILFFYFYFINIIILSGFDSYHKIVVCDHARVPKFWRTWRMWANTKKHISDIIPFT